MSSSSGEGISSAKLDLDKKASNLTRIRDNQRRSRARHKEYVQELEEKYRECQQNGSEASKEVQAAARAVLEENLRLRALLEQQGLAQPMSGAGSSSVLLHSLLTTKRPCCDEGERGVGASLSITPSAGKQHRVEASISPVASKSANRGPGPAVNFSPSAPYGMPWILPSTPDMQPADKTGQVQPLTTQSVMTSPSTMTCSDAVGLIRGSFPSVDGELEQDMNCSGNPARCAVPNTRVFELMDKYGWG